MKGLISETRIHNKNDKPVTYSRFVVTRKIGGSRRWEISISLIPSFERMIPPLLRRKCLVTVADILRLSRISPWRNGGRRGSRGERLEENAARGKLLSSQRLCAFLREFANLWRCSSNMDVFWTYSPFSSFLFLSLEYFDRIDRLIRSLRMWLLE